MRHRPHLPHALRRRDAPGFSLVELLVVIVVLGIVATVTIFAVRGITSRGEDASCAADARVLLTASDAYMVQEAVDVIPATGTDDDRYERTLVDAGLLGSISTYYVLDDQGRVSTSGEPCD